MTANVENPYTQLGVVSGSINCLGSRLLCLLLLHVLVAEICEHAANDNKSVETNAYSSASVVGGRSKGAGNGGLGGRVTGL